MITIHCNIAGFVQCCSGEESERCKDGRRGRQSGCRRRVSAKGKAFMRIRAIKKNWLDSDGHLYMLLTSPLTAVRKTKKVDANRKEKRLRRIITMCKEFHVEDFIWFFVYILLPRLFYKSRVLFLARVRVYGINVPMNEWEWVAGESSNVSRRRVYDCFSFFASFLFILYT